MKKLKKLICYLGIHWNKLKFQKGANDYYECKWCGRRICSPGIYGYSPIDYKWLREKK